MRGAVDEQAVTGALLPQQPGAAAADAGIPSPVYEPASEGAIPGNGTAQATDSIFDEAPVEPVRPRPPTTARDRAEERRTNAAQATAESEADDTDTTGTVPEPTVDADAVADLRTQPTGERIQAIEDLDRPVDDDPYAPLGLRLGTFNVTTSLEQGLTATSNADFSTDGSSAILSETTLRLNAVSDWAVNEARLNAYGTYRTSISGEELNEVEAGIDASTEYEIGDDLIARGAIAYINRPESAASPVIIADTVSQPTHQIFSGSAELEKAVGKARFGLTGEIIHDQYGDADLADGTTVSQADRDATLYAATLRGGYEISPAFTPFLEGEIGWLQYDEPVDSAGYERSGDRYAIRAGLSSDMGEKLSGEIAAGYVEETLEDERLAPIKGPSVEANVNWSPMRGTNVNLWGASLVEGTTTPGESGSILYLARLTAQRQIRANLTGEAIGGVGYRDYSGMNDHDWLFNAEASLTWWLNRYLGLTGRAEYESVTSTLPDRDTETGSVFLGLKLQR